MSKGDQTLWLVDDDNKLLNIDRLGNIISTVIDLDGFISSLSKVEGLSLAT